MTLGNGERQVAPGLSGIRRDHVARYEWAARVLKPGSNVIDVACGVGYGAHILAAAGHIVLAIDRDDEAIAYAKQHYAHPNIRFVAGTAEKLAVGRETFDAAVSFETIEHLASPEVLLGAFRAAKIPLLLASVPNETVFPFRCEANRFQGWAHHHRHYTRGQFGSLLSSAGFRVVDWLGQADAESSPAPEVEGRTLVVRAEMEEAGQVAAPARAEGAPDHVAIVGLGPSSEEYFKLVKQMGGRHALADEVWAVNALGDVLACDRIFHMDDVAVQEIRAAANPSGNIAEMVKWLRKHPGPIYTSVVRPGYPGLVSFPLEEVLSAGGVPYLNNTVAYAIAYARHIGVKKLSLYGVDFTYANNHKAERGRACCEFWLGLCMASGMQVELTDKTALMDACAPPAELTYGYDGFDVILHDKEGGGVWVELREKPLPSAEDVEKRYDHGRHPNRLVAGDTQ